MKTMIEIDFEFEPADEVSVNYLTHGTLKKTKDALLSAIQDSTDKSIEWAWPLPFNGPDDPAYLAALTTRVVTAVDSGVMHDLRSVLDDLARPDDVENGGCNYSLLNDSGTVCLPCLPGPCHKCSGVILASCPGSRPFEYLWAPMIEGERCAFSITVIYTLKLTGSAS